MSQQEENKLKRKADVPMEFVMAEDDDVEDEEVDGEEEEEADRRFLGFLYGIQNLEARDPRLEALNRQAGEMLERLEQGVFSMRLELEILNDVAENQRAANATNEEEAVGEGEQVENNGGQAEGEEGNEKEDVENDD
ncbi:hypothetical protein CAEBREN_18945 [Caenorhabditis brenneri]|uniref:Uncharacterized protein n=1 Tax=Caenorhabditis brenneri TaxID=135651 RepID=G0MY82_CAEBE|nr:hypothetical protein CAEBREN_18945 [Caenorhabditis brenneri]